MVENRKKYFLLILTCVLVNILPAEEFALSAGLGLSAGGLFTRYTLTAEGKVYDNPVNVEAKQKMNQFNFGGYLFLDAKWAELSVGAQGGLNNFEETTTITPEKEKPIVSALKGTGSEIMLTLTLLLKYPFTPNEKIKLFPLLGIDYQIAFMETRKPEGRLRRDRTDEKYGESDSHGNTYTLSMWNSMFIIIGGGMDYNLTSHLFLRGELLYGIRTETSYETDALEKARWGLNAPNPKYGGLSSGPTLRIATGWRF